MYSSRIESHKNIQQLQKYIQFNTKGILSVVFYIFYMYQLFKNIIKEKSYKCFFENVTFH